MHVNVGEQNIRNTFQYSGFQYTNTIMYSTTSEINVELIQHQSDPVLLKNVQSKFPKSRIYCWAVPIFGFKFSRNFYFWGIWL